MLTSCMQIATLGIVTSELEVSTINNSITRPSVLADWIITMKQVQLSDKDIRTLLAPIAERIKSASHVLQPDYQQELLWRLTDKELEEVIKEREAEIAYLKGLSNKLAHSQD